MELETEFFSFKSLWEDLKTSLLLELIKMAVVLLVFGDFEAKSLSLLTPRVYSFKFLNLAIVDVK